jgi:hypothetical protein
LNSGSSGTYTLNSGPLSVGIGEFIGFNGNGTFTQTGGTNTVGSGGFVQVGGHATGAYNLNGGTLNGQAEIIAAFNSTGTFTQTAGVNNATALTVAFDAAATGTYDLQGGTLNAVSVIVNPTGTFKLDGGTATVGSGGFQNAGLLQVQGKGGTINGVVTNTGTVTTGGTSVAFNGPFTNSGTYTSNGAMQRFETLVNTAAGVMQGAFGDQFIVTGDFLNHSTQGSLWNTSQSVLDFAAGASDVHTLLINGANFGIGQAGYENNFAWGTLKIDTGESLILGDGLADLSSLAQADAAALPEALYVQDMLGAVISGDEITNITGDGRDIYYDPFLDANAYLGGLDYALEGGGELIADAAAPPLPEPGTLALVIPGLGLAFATRGRRAMRSATAMLRIGAP